MSSSAAESADQTESFRARMPFAATLGLSDVVATRDAVQATLAWDPSRCTTVGTMHGGAIMALADSIGGYCAFLNLPEGAAGTTTIESKTNFLRPLRSGKLHATARPLQVGRTVIVVDTEMRDDDGRLVARTTQTQAVLQPR